MIKSRIVFIFTQETSMQYEYIMHLPASPLHTASPILKIQGDLVPGEIPDCVLHLKIKEINAYL